MSRPQSKYPVLGAALALPEFTIADVVRRTGLNEETVRSVLRRESRIDEVGVEETGRKGGQPKVYRLREEAVEDVYEELEGLFDAVLAGSGHEVAGPPIPSALESAEAVLAEAEKAGVPATAALEAVGPVLRSARGELARDAAGGRAADALASLTREIADEGVSVAEARQRVLQVRESLQISRAMAALPARPLAARLAAGVGDALRHIRAGGAARVGPPEPVLIVQAPARGPDVPLVVRNLLHEFGALDRRAARFECPAAIEELESAAAVEEFGAAVRAKAEEVARGEPLSVVLAMDSTSDPHFRCYAMTRELLRAPRVVLDTGNSTALQQLVLEDGGEYVFQAEDVSAAALHALLGRQFAGVLTAAIPHRASGVFRAAAMR